MAGAAQVTDTLFNQFLGEADKTLRQAYQGTSYTEHGQAASRTATNREYLVQQFFERALPVATRTVLGSVLVDSGGRRSGDVDIAVIAPWGAPIWPYHAHPLIPCEGVISAVFCEASDVGPSSGVWRQIANARLLFKAVDVGGGRTAEDVPRGRTPNLGLWCWGKPTGAQTNLKAWMGRARMPKRSARRTGVRADPEVRELYKLDPTKRSKLLQHLEKSERPLEGCPGFSVHRAIAVGAHTPNWIYWHDAVSDGEYKATGKKARFAFRIHRRLKPEEGEWSTSRVMPGWRKKRHDKKSECVQSEDGQFEWRYVLIDGKNARPLKALLAYLSNQVVSYGNERPMYGAYIDG